LATSGLVATVRRHGTREVAAARARRFNLKDETVDRREPSAAPSVDMTKNAIVLGKLARHFCTTSTGRVATSFKCQVHPRPGAPSVELGSRGLSLPITAASSAAGAIPDRFDSSVLSTVDTALCRSTNHRACTDDPFYVVASRCTCAWLFNVRHSRRLPNAEQEK